MAHFIEKNSMGLDVYCNDDEDDELRMHYIDDYEPVLNRATAIRNSGLADRRNREEFYMYASIPPIIIMDWLNRLGVDIFDKNHTKRVMELLNGDYKYLKTTTKRHTVAH